MTELPQGLVALLLVGQRPARFVFLEMRHRLVVLFAIVLYDEVVVGQPEVGLQILAQTAFVVMVPDGFFLEADVVVAQP